MYILELSDIGNMISRSVETFSHEGHYPINECGKCMVD